MKKLFITLIIFIVIVSSVAFWWLEAMQAVNPTDKSQMIFVVKKGESIREVAYALKNDSLIRDPIAFFLLVKEKNYEGKIQAGDFRLSPSMNLETLSMNLTHGTLDLWITIPEGKRAYEIAQILKDKIPTYDDSWRIKLMQHEGTLFPDTYLIPRDAGIEAITNQMQHNFNIKFSTLQNSQTAYTQDQIITVASLIEREAKFAEDRPKVASVIYNRLKNGMPLQIDATVQYALGYSQTEQSWWKKNLTVDDLKIISPYNTYINTGLPPTPICNPGISALGAAVNPANTNYIFYISDNTGHLHFAKTLDEHNANIRKYGV